MDVKAFDYDPPEDRSSSRLMVLDKKTGDIEHKIFRDVVDYLQPGDCLVLNNTKVIPARLFGVKEGTEAKIEILLLKRKENDIWETLVKPGKKCKPGVKISFGEGLLTGEVLEVVEDGNRLIQFHYDGIFEEILLPCNVLRMGEDVFLDDITLTELKRTLQVQADIVKSSGQDLLNAVLGRRQNE